MRVPQAVAVKIDPKLISEFENLMLERPPQVNIVVRDSMDDFP